MADTIRVWVTKYALTEGFIRELVVETSHTPSMVTEKRDEHGMAYDHHYHGKDWYRNRQDAVQRAEDMNEQIEPPYECRFIRKEHIGKIVRLYHLARTALSDQPHDRQTPYDRMLWASGQYHREHPEISETAAYKDLCGLLDR